MDNKYCNTYEDFCKLASENDEYFNTFRSNTNYTHVLEHVSYIIGYQYYIHILNNKMNIDDDLSKLLKTDLYGTPTRYNYPKVGMISPTILRYYSVISDIEKSYGNLNNKTVVEIGCGYGGQSMLINLMYDIKKYIIVDLYNPLQLIKKFLLKNNMDMSKYEFYAADDVKDIEKIKSDFLISNYAFSECSKSTQDVYINKFINNTKHFYMICNFVPGFSGNTKEELLTKISGPVNVVPEQPMTHYSNLLFYK